MRSLFADFRWCIFGGGCMSWYHASVPTVVKSGLSSQPQTSIERVGVNGEWFNSRSIRLSPWRRPPTTDSRPRRKGRALAPQVWKQKTYYLHLIALLDIVGLSRKNCCSPVRSRTRHPQEATMLRVSNWILPWVFLPNHKQNSSITMHKQRSFCSNWRHSSCHHTNTMGPLLLSTWRRSVADAKSLDVACMIAWCAPGRARITAMRRPPKTGRSVESLGSKLAGSPLAVPKMMAPWQHSHFSGRTQQRCRKIYQNVSSGSWEVLKLDAPSATTL